MENDCDETSESCRCLVPHLLLKENFNAVTVPTYREQVQLTNLTQLCRWGLLNLWSKANEGDFIGDLFETMPQDLSKEQVTDSDGNLELSFSQLDYIRD